VEIDVGVPDATAPLHGVIDTITSTLPAALPTVALPVTVPPAPVDISSQPDVPIEAPASLPKVDTSAPSPPPVELPSVP
jgi:hypothetical protein